MLDSDEGLRAENATPDHGSRDTARTARQTPEQPREVRVAGASVAHRLPIRRIALVAALVLALGAIYGQYWARTGRYIVSTDDAYVGARSTTLSPKVAGYVSAILVSDNAEVKAGDVLLRIDAGDYALAVTLAKDQVGVQQATVARLGRQVVAQEANVEQARAQLASSKAAATRATLELKRQQDLASRQINSRQSLEQAEANAEQSNAGVQSAQAAINAAVANVDVLKAQQEEARRTLKQLETNLAKAERDLSFTEIRAPFDGVLGNRAVQVGDYVQPTVRLASLVPLGAVYVDANFKETQLSSLKPGQPVQIEVDALPGREIEGRVASFAPASGSVFSLLPPDNATGNFTKVVQRVPVRILVPMAVAEQAVLRPGMSVIVKVNTKPGAPQSATAMSTDEVAGRTAR